MVKVCVCVRVCVLVCVCVCVCVCARECHLTLLLIPPRLGSVELLGDLGVFTTSAQPSEMLRLTAAI